MRYLVTCLTSAIFATTFPLGTFSTFMNETSSLLHEAPIMSIVYVATSLAVGMIMLVLGSMAARAL